MSNPNNAWITREVILSAIEDLPGTDIVELAAEFGIDPEEIYNILSEIGENNDR